MSMQQMLVAGGMSLVVPLPGGTTDSDGTAPGPATVDLNVTSDGRVTGSGSTTPIAQNWFQPTTASIGTNFWVRASLTGGSAPSAGTTGSWLQLSSSRQWTNTRITLPGSKTSTLLIEIASDAAGANIITSGSYTLTATLS